MDGGWKCVVDGCRSSTTRKEGGYASEGIARGGSIKSLKDEYL